jgi:hypothetical protein
MLVVGLGRLYRSQARWFWLARASLPCGLGEEGKVEHMSLKPGYAREFGFVVDDGVNSQLPEKKNGNRGGRP